ncbi:MAG: hypothetical protein ACRC6H_09525 [Culicoidibacterales bacterium]
MNVQLVVVETIQIGKFSNIMNNTFQFLSIQERHTLPFLKRKMKNGMWIILSSSGVPLVVTEKILFQLQQENLNTATFDIKTFSDLEKFDFIGNLHNQKKLNIEPRGIMIFIFRFSILIFGILSFFILITSIYNTGLPFHNISNFLIDQPFHFIVTLILSSVFFTFTHEFMHGVFANNLISSACLSLNFTKSVATINITHIWTWSLFGRLLAISSGILLDLIWTSIFYLLIQKFNSPYLFTFCGVLITKILWQFQLFRNTDIQLFIMLLVDNPFLFSDPPQKHFNFLIHSTKIIPLIIFYLWISPFFI